MKYLDEVAQAKTFIKTNRVGGKSYIDGMTVYTNNKNQLHRVDGPAISHDNGTAFWYVNNIKINSVQQLQREANLSDEEILGIALKYGNKL